MAKINALNETLLTILQNSDRQWLTNGAIKQAIYQNSIGGIRLSDIDIRTLIKNLRFGGHPIIAGYDGYKYTTDKQELQQYIASRKLELESELNILRKMEGKW